MRPDADLLSNEVDALIEQWSAEEQALFSELYEDAGSELQRELLLRVVAARHSPAEVHAFADEIRGFDDEQLYDVCTVSAATPNVPVTHRFRAEADPLFAMEVNGHSLTPRLEDDAGPAYSTRPRFRAPPALMVAPPAPRVGAPPKPSFEAESRGEDRSTVSRVTAAPKRSSSPLNEAVRSLGLSYREQKVDRGELTLERALELAASALGKGIPIPVMLGRKVGELGRQVLMLQVSPSGKVRAFQLHDPLSQETVWAHERDLLRRTELPFDAKTFRRITAVSLPVAPSRAPVR